MKKILLLLPFCLFIGTVYGQLPNSSFESWNSTPYDEPTGFQTGNHESVSLGLIPVTRVNGTSGYAVRMQTLVSNGDTANAYIANGDPSGNGGVPYAQQPTAITGNYRYNLPANDTAIILVLFKSNGVVFSMNVFKIKGTGTQNTFTAFSFPLSIGATPDTVIIAAASSNLIDEVGIESGSFLELDNIAFTGTNTPVPNGTFENWSTFNNDAINGWETFGEGVSKTNDSYVGSSAISFQTIDYGNGNIGTSGMSLGHYSNNGPPVGGIAYSETADTLTGYYQYLTSGSDSAVVSVSLMLNSNNISGNQVLLPATSQYTYFEIPIYSGTAPDTLRVDFSSSKWPTSPSSVGSTLIVDHLQLKSVIAANVQFPETKKKESLFLFPNPASDVLNIRFTKSDEVVLIEIYDLSGKLMIRDYKNVSENILTISTSSLKPGRYFYRIYSRDGKYEQAFSKN